MADKSELEVRAFQKLEQRNINEETNTMTIDGYAIVWDVDYPIGGGSTSSTGFDERVSRGAAAKSLKKKPMSASSSTIPAYHSPAQNLVHSNSSKMKLDYVSPQTST